MASKKLTHRTTNHRPRTRGSDLPVYDSITIASAATGIPEEAFYVAIKDGCLCKHHNRIDLGEFLAWWFKDPEEDDPEKNINWKRRGDRADALLKEIELMRAQRTSLEKANVLRFLSKMLGLFFDELDRYKSEFPGTLVGKDSPHISMEVDMQIDKTRKYLASSLERFEKEHAEP